MKTIIPASNQTVVLSLISAMSQRTTDAPTHIGADHSIRMLHRLVCASW
ncbi:hypothetical protein OV079_39980 [Nannocystis pusilla]|uniref:Uncharacterized protein n=1 Tax=Nannocystis pusilla TaxID=889268 RepID=A0A9X3J2D1_9BACT|nr:hypothetical protein [Nannocystis pusilla]MCY1011639.1 hypothetical protein [Nannocystis pusilla]